MESSATGDPWNLHFVQSERWPFMRSFRALFVSPTYCLPHLVHVIRYMIFANLQFVCLLSFTDAPEDDSAIWVGVISLYVRHLLLPQGFDSPVGSSSLVG